MDLSIIISTIISIIAVIISPIIAIWVGEKIRIKNYQKEREDKLLEKLIAYRYVLSSAEFLSALNSIDYVFYKNEKIKELVKNLHRAYTNKENILTINQRVVELIYEICKYKKYNVTEYEIQNLFIPIKSSGVEMKDSFSQNPSSTSGQSKNEEKSITMSKSITSITGSYLSL